MLRFLTGIIVGVLLMMAVDGSKALPEGAQSALASAKSSLQAYLAKALEPATQPAPSTVGKADATPASPARAAPKVDRAKRAPARSSPLLFQR
jgi:hypothetical protein